MITTLTKCDFMDAFHDMKRFEQFGYNALSSLFDYLETEDRDEELDVIGLCCSYSVDSVNDIATEYDIDISAADDEDEEREIVVDFLNENTMVIDENCANEMKLNIETLEKIQGKILYCQF